MAISQKFHVAAETMAVPVVVFALHCKWKGYVGGGKTLSYK